MIVVLGSGVQGLRFGFRVSGVRFRVSGFEFRGYILGVPCAVLAPALHVNSVVAEAAIRLVCTWVVARHQFKP
jgi:hypothetical protein